MHKIKFILSIVVISRIFITNNLFGQNEINNSETIINLLGQRLKNLFDKYGLPFSIEGLDNGTALLYYDEGEFGFSVKSKSIIAAFFTKEYQYKVRGIAIEDTKSTVVEILGEPKKNYYGKDKSTNYLEFDYPENDLRITIAIDTENKVNFIIVSLK
ncbi:MAG: hypothetical protein N2490_02130 [Ignavibacteria bacterium]|nr:hypothetical protein [Ignavibacteria bacterium]